MLSLLGDCHYMILLFFRQDVGVLVFASGVGYTKLFSIQCVWGSYVSGVSLSLFCVSLSLFDVSLSLLEVSLSLFDVSLSLVDVSLSLFEVSLSLLEVSLSLFDVSLS